MKKNTIQASMQTIIRYVFGGVGLSILVLGALYAFEAVPARFATPVAEAWHCDWMEASPASITKGESSTLSWSFVGTESNVYVTVSSFGSKQFAGTNGSVQVTPTQTTNYIATAHRPDTSTTYTCSAQVVVTEPEPEPEPCTCELTADPTTISSGGQSVLTLATSNAVSAEINNGVGTIDPNGTVTVSPTQTTTYTATVTNTSGNTIDCTTTVNVEVPILTAPVCPFTPSGARTVIDFNGGKDASKATKLLSNNSSKYEMVRGQVLPAGTYTVETVSWDGYSDRVNTTQVHEQWNVEGRAGSTVLAEVGPTTDLADKVVEDTQLNTYTNAFVLTEATTDIALVHAFQGDTSSANSVVPICVAFERKVETPTPACTMTATNTLIEKGASTTISWTGTNIASATFSNLTSTDIHGSETVSPLTSTIYTGTFVGSNGDTEICSVEVKVTEPTAGPSCTLDLSASQVAAGSVVTLSWTSSNTDTGSIDQNIGAVATSGSKSVVVNTDTTYTGTFIGTNGVTVTCSDSVTISTGGGGGGGGGGGSCLNCGDDDDDTPGGGGGGGGGGGSTPNPDPNIFLSKTVTKTGGFITLDQVPYTGFEAGPLMTTLFWLGVLAVSAGIAYVVTFVHPISRLRQVAAIHHIQESKESHATHMSAASTMMAPGLSIALNQHDIPTMSSGTDTANDFVEAVAHRENILLSPEALRAILSEMDRTDMERNSFLADLFNKAKAEFAREDGWILLSKERINTLFAAHGSNPATSAPRAETTASVQDAPRVAQPAPAPAPAQSAPTPMTSQRGVRTNDMTHAGSEQTATRQQTAVPTHSFTNTAPVSAGTFVGWLVEGKEQETFAHLRSASAKEHSVESFIGQVVRSLDDVYKHRLEGNHNPDPELARLTATWSNGDFEKVLGILVECIDYSYASNRIGSKVALAKAFEYFRSQKS